MLTLKEEQEISLELMNKLHTYCVNNNLRYLMACGTLLGAVRHKGFIPWDNDIDLLMPRTDFNNLLDIQKTNPIDKDVFIEHYTVDEKYHYQCMRICDANTSVYVDYIREQPKKLGIWIDIFPVDGFTDSKLLSKIQNIQLILRKNIFKSHIYIGNNRFKKIVIFLYNHFFPCNNNVLYEIDKISQRYSFESKSKSSCLFDDFYSTVDREEFDNPILYSFEKYSFFGPKKYDDYLKNKYGDYMILPPESKRIVHLINAERNSN